MRQLIVQKPPTVAVQGPPIPSENQFRLDALVQQQKFIVTRIVQLEGQQKELEQELASTNGAQHQKVVASLVENNRDLQTLRVSLTDTRQKIAELQGEMEQGVPPVPVQEWQTGSLLDPRPDLMFGMSKPEFGAAVSLALLFPLVIAFAVRLVQRGAKARGSAPALDDARFTRLEQAVESVAIEVERIGEAQRFAAKLLAERQTESASARDI